MPNSIIYSNIGSPHSSEVGISLMSPETKEP